MTRATLTTAATAVLAGAVVFRLLASGGGPAAPPAAGDLSESAPATIDRDASWVVAVTERAGMLGFLGHRHAVLATDWTAELRYVPEEPSDSSVQVSVPTAATRIDTERGLALADLDEGPDAETVATLQEKLHAPANLAAQEHPEIRFVSTGVERAGRSLRVTGEITIRGTTRRVSFPVAAERGDAGRTAFTGAFTIDQSDFGIEPESVAGVVKVADPVEVRFHISALAGGV